MRFSTSQVSFLIPDLSSGTTTTPIDCLTVFSVSFVISFVDQGLAGSFEGEGSNDGVVWVPVTGSIAPNSPVNVQIPSNSTAFAAHRYYRVKLSWGSGSASNVKVTVVTKGY